MARWNNVLGHLKTWVPKKCTIQGAILAPVLFDDGRLHLSSQLPHTIGELVSLAPNSCYEPPGSPIMGPICWGPMEYLGLRMLHTSSSLSPSTWDPETTCFLVVGHKGHRVPAITTQLTQGWIEINWYAPEALVPILQG